MTVSNEDILNEVKALHDSIDTVIRKLEDLERR